MSSHPDSSSSILKSTSSSSIHSHQHQHHKAQEIYLSQQQQQFVSSSHKHKIETQHNRPLVNETTPTKSKSTSGESDEDVLHVVTNVYTIPIIKSSSTHNGVSTSTTTTSTTTPMATSQTSTTLHNSMSIPIVLGEPRVDSTRIRSSSTSEQARTVIRRVTDSEKSVQQLNQELNQSSEQANGATKSKFQIRSIVEIYENQDEQQQQQQQAKDVGYFNTNTQFNETITKEVIPDLKKGTKKYLGLSRNCVYFLLNPCLY